MNRVGVGVERELTFDEKVRLRDVFLQLPGMWEQASRDIYIAQLAKQFPGVLATARHDDPQRDVWSVLEVCYELPGGVTQLLEIVSGFHRGNRRLVQLRAIVESFFPAPLLRDSERDLLIELLGKVEVPTVAASYRYAARAAFYEPPPDPTDVVTVVHRMEAHVGIPGELPAMFEFADHVAHQTHRGVEGDLHRWLYQVAARLGFADRAVRDAMCEATRMRLSRMRRYYFAVQLVPDGVLADRYLLSAWLQHDHNPEEPIHCDDNALPLSSAVERLYDLLRQVPDHVDEDIEELMVELILPRALITRPVDQWQVDRALPHALGTAYPLVVRSLDRLQSANLHATWGRKWRWLMNNGGHADRTHFREVETHDQQTAAALRAMLLRGEPPVALVMLTPPVNSDDLRPDTFTAGLYGGVPVMMWCRDSTMSEDFTEQIRDRLTRDGLLGLPQRVFELRLMAAEHVAQGRPHVGCHLTLLWDDFDRIPELFRRRARVQAPRPRTAGNS
jgi:hypothetical protein